MLYAKGIYVQNHFTESGQIVDITTLWKMSLTRYFQFWCYFSLTMTCVEICVGKEPIRQLQSWQDKISKAGNCQTVDVEVADGIQAK